ncbi:MAG: hypothetical protein ABSC19_07840 [Syntrophorhabdales bacterium]|jgi:predicted amidophosphoribosyltransferase
MLCEACARKIDALTCSGCGSVIARLGPFCYACGARLSDAALEDDAPAKDAPGEEADFSARILCSDGTCIGVVDERGVCKVCGKPYAPES